METKVKPVKPEIKSKKDDEVNKALVAMWGEIFKDVEGFIEKLEKLLESSDNNTNSRIK